MGMPNGRAAATTTQQAPTAEVGPLTTADEGPPDLCPIPDDGARLDRPRTGQCERRIGTKQEVPRASDEPDLSCSFASRTGGIHGIPEPGVRRLEWPPTSL
jgi:hypothetical protein